MEIYLIRHTEPVIAKGTCYGQSDIDVSASFFSEAAIIREHLPDVITAVYSSPLRRCKRLAEYLFPGHAIQLEHDLKEIDCGKWELMLWNDISKEEIDPWMNDLINVCIPGGESYRDLFQRVVQCFGKITRLPGTTGQVSSRLDRSETPSNIVIVAHGGVIRSILSHITNTPLLDSFKVFSLHYGCVIKIVYEQSVFQHQVLSNIVREKETHKPSAL